MQEGFVDPLASYSSGLTRFELVGSWEEREMNEQVGKYAISYVLPLVTLNPSTVWQFRIDKLEYSCGTDRCN